MNSSQRCISSSFSPCTSPEERRYRKSWTVVFVKLLNTNGRHYRLFHAPSGRRFFATKINYYSNSVASFQMMRLTRSGDISENPGPKNSLRCFLQNVRSLKAAVADGDSFEYKSAILRDIAYGYDLDVICLTETWLNDSISDSELLPTANNVFRKDRKSRGGGTLIAVKSNLPTRELEIATTLECVAVEINLSPEKTLLLINCYRPPSDQEFFHDFKDVITNFRLDKYWSALIVGDFNYPGINWIDGSGFTNSTSSKEQQFADFIMDHYFYQLVDKPTRVNNILDLVLSNSPISIASVESSPSLADVGVPSDHYPVIFEIEV